MSGVAALASCAALLSAGPAWARPVAAARTAGHAASLRAAAAGQEAPARANLLVNPGAEAGAVSGHGWDSVTIPVWQVVSGLPTTVRYGTKRFPQPTGRWPLVRGGHLFAGGAGGTARLRQVVQLRRAAGASHASAMHFRLSAWLGGTSDSSAAVTVAFVSGTGRMLGHAAIGPAGKERGTRLSARTARGTVPPGTVAARVTLVLATALTNFDGPYAPKVGYDRALADGLRFSVSAPVRRPPPLVPPVAHVPRYQHVFMFYFENEDFGSVIGNTRQAPYLNSLLPRASLLSDFFAEEHPSDANYLALAGGSSFGVPLTNPLEINPRYTIHARNIGDLADAAHQTWKEYLQSANGPCDDTVHGYYWNDDLPMTYFADVRNRPGYCSAHLVPLQALGSDLASAATTPNFAWLGADDCTDMEGCGIRAGDRFLAAELGAIERSPAWRTQRSLAIITFDEDGYDHEHPAQRVATLVLGSAGVRKGYVSHVRYTHYSLLRTIEAALGLGTLTPNDRYAQPVNDVFGHQAAPSAPAATLPSAPPAEAALGGAATGGRAPTAASRAAAPTRDPTAFVVNSGSDTVTPIDLTTRRAGPAITVGSDPQGVAITPDGRTAYVTNTGSGTVTPIDTASRRAGPPIRVGHDPRGIAITPDGRTAYVLDWGSAAVTPVSTASDRAGPPIRVGGYPFAIAFAPGGATAYVASYGANTVTPITVATGHAERAIPVGQAPDALAVTPDATTVYAAAGDSGTVTAIGTGTGHERHQIPAGYSPEAIAISGNTAFVVNTISSTVTPVSTRTGRPGAPIPVGVYTYPTAITLAPSGHTAIVVGSYAGKVTLIDTRTREATAHITVGAYPVAAAVAR